MEAKNLFDKAVSVLSMTLALGGCSFVESEQNRLRDEFKNVAPLVLGKVTTSPKFGTQPYICSLSPMDTSESDIRELKLYPDSVHCRTQDGAKSMTSVNSESTSSRFSLQDHFVMCRHMLKGCVSELQDK